MEQQFKKVPEATYLATEKSEKYRAILRYFYIQHERLKEDLIPEEILTHLKESPFFALYTLDELKLDLTSLVKWGNLNAQQESGRVKSIEEFNNKRFRYQITPYTVEFERMLIRFEQDSEAFTGSLERNQFERFEQSIRKIKEFLSEKSEESSVSEQSHQIWDDIMTYFKKITQNTSDYFAYLRSEDATEHMQSDAFLLYKDRFTNYLREFIKALYRTVAAIQQTMKELSASEMQQFFNFVAAHEATIFRFETKESETFIKECHLTWENIKAWFLGDVHGNSQYQNVLNQTNEAIRRLTSIVQRLGERNRIGASRKDDYLHLASWFLRSDSIEEAHRLSSVVFGLSHTKHIYSDYIPTDDIYMESWVEPPMDYGRSYRDSTKRTATKASALIDRAVEKEKYRQYYLKEQEREQKIIESYRHEDRIIIEELPIVEPFMRKLFLSWIGKAMVSKDELIKTEYGDEIKVEIDKNRSVILKAKDGEMKMPATTFRFIKEAL